MKYSHSPQRMTRVTQCTAPDCEKPPVAHGWCMTHYRRWRRQGDPLIALWHKREGQCRVEGCEQPVYRNATMLCRTHFERLRRTGTTDPPPPAAWLTTDPKRCDIAGCERPVLAHGLCDRHESRQRRGYPLDAPPRRPWKEPGPCSHEGCVRPVYARALCRNHYGTMRYAERKAQRRAEAAS